MVLLYLSSLCCRAYNHMCLFKEMKLYFMLILCFKLTALIDCVPGTWKCINKLPIDMDLLVFIKMTFLFQSLNLMTGMHEMIVINSKKFDNSSKKFDLSSIKSIFISVYIFRIDVKTTLHEAVTAGNWQKQKMNQKNCKFNSIETNGLRVLFFFLLKTESDNCMSILFIKCSPFI